MRWGWGEMGVGWDGGGVGWGWGEMGVGCICLLILL